MRRVSIVVVFALTVAVPLLHAGDRMRILVDADTGWGGAFMIGRTIREMSRAGAAGCHIEDQVGVKRCGHRPGKALVETAEMCDRIKAAVDGRGDDAFVIMARTDANPPMMPYTDEYTLVEVDADYLTKAVKPKQFIHINEAECILCAGGVDICPWKCIHYLSIDAIAEATNVADPRADEDGGPR